MRWRRIALVRIRVKPHVEITHVRTGKRNSPPKKKKKKV